MTVARKILGIEETGDHTGYVTATCGDRTFNQADTRNTAHHGYHGIHPSTRCGKEKMSDKMIRCPEGHFYDPSKHSACPWCASPQDMPFELPEKPVRYAGPENPPPLPPPLPSAAPHPAPAVHAEINAMPAETHDPVVGWLVCLDGPDRGKDFRLHMEKNYIGRAPSMDVALERDRTVSREKHGVVIFDPKRRAFWVLSGESSGLVYLNGEIVNTPMQMQADDVIELGQTKLVLIPFCGEKYTWSDHTA